jgi:hypothetical protein
MADITEHFCYKCRKTASEMPQMLMTLFLEEVMGRRQTCEWFLKLKNGLTLAECSASIYV